MESLNRRAFITTAVLGATALMLPKSTWAFALKEQRYKVAVIDLMILKRQKLGAVKLTSEIGADGLEVDMGGLGNRDTFDNQFFDDAFRTNYLNELKEYGIEVASVAMTGFYAQSFATRPTYQQMVGDCLKTCQLLGAKIAFLPLGVQGDLVQNPELRPAIVERLKEVGKMAKRAGVIVGIETALDAQGDVELLKEIGSKNIQIYFNFSNPLKEGRDLIKELQILGKKRICQIHCTDEDGVWLEHNTRLDMPNVKEALDKMGWKGWLVIERSRDASLSPRMVKENFGANTKYVKSIFQK
ncbi:sugar phosphate isomerase/epimerase [Sphingobacterium sp. DN00404]|uniref:Sugar phosphate isomerase/epimerase n=1 Tax=Sphingobacterium micropteri TaxID=2763501 RepID=A0ABR7YPI7_9SPHI|nr:sugar phosphate isomerase/epimerase family protein [Sphingobacterium micropteri]MBD1433241.1 sugar phosphate isomerase/epimerase [Sphingobacterium micropteri]